MRRKLIQLMSILLIVITLLSLAGCKKSYDPVDLIECNEGKYKIPKIVEGEIKMSGQDVSHMEIIKTNGYCNLILVLNEPMVLLGTEIEKVPMIECEYYCIDQARIMGYNDTKTFQACCYES